MNDKRLEKINFITGVFSGCLWLLEDNELDKLYEQSEVFHNGRVEKGKRLRS